MKIAICVQYLTSGGAERVAALWAQGFVERGHQVMMILSNVRIRQTYSLPKSIPIFNVDVDVSNKFIRGILKLFLKIPKLRQILKEQQPDIVISVMDDWLPMLLAANWNLPSRIISTEHNSFERPVKVPMRIKERLRKFYCNRYVNAITVLTNADKCIIENRLKNVFVLPNPLAFNSAKEIPQKKKIFLAAGRLDAGYTKGFDLLIKAFGISCMDDWILQIAGGGKPESFEKYKQLAKQCGVENKVQFLGYVDNPLPLYKDASIFVLSSRYEAFGMVLIEAMSQGCACIACDYKGRQSEIISEENEGLLCEVDNVNALALSMKRMMFDDSYREKCGRNAIKRSRCFALSEIMDKWDHIIASMDSY